MVSFSLSCKAFDWLAKLLTSDTKRHIENPVLRSHPQQERQVYHNLDLQFDRIS